MRAPIIGLIYVHRPAELRDAAQTSALITHAHPIGIEGALLLARAAASALLGASSRHIVNEGFTQIANEAYASRLAIARQWLESNQDVDRGEVIRLLGNGIAGHTSCVTALYLALRFRDESYAEMHKFISSCGGDVDTIGAMAGAIWGAANGYARLPVELLEKLEQRERLLDLAKALFRRSQADRDGPDTSKG